MISCVVPYFQNDSGYELVEIGVREFMCIGANPPFDHPHIFLEMGIEKKIICPYCATLYRFNPNLENTTESYPEDCRYVVSELGGEADLWNKK